MATAEQRIMDMLEPAVSALGVELYGLELHRRGKQGDLLRIYIDHEDGVNLEHCQAVSHQVSGILDVEDPLSGQYDLEVSSPGLDRLLFRIEHYIRFIGQEAKIQLFAPHEGRRKFTARIQAVEENTIDFDCEGELLQIDLTQIDRARLVPDL